MASFLIGVVAVVVILWFMHKFVRANPTGMARLLQKGGGIIAIVGAVFLALRGGLAVALPLAFMGFGLLGWMPGNLSGLWGQPGGRRVSRVRTAFLEVDFDQDSGAMRGRVIAGRAAGAALETLDRATLTALLAEFDDDSRQLLMAYLDRRNAGGGENPYGGAYTRQGTATRPGKMTEEEAYQVLGLQPGAGAEEIGRAYRTLMKKLHPDQGGSTYLAARVNEAKEVLLRRHR
jgi:hypothetical protein